MKNSYDLIAPGVIGCLVAASSVCGCGSSGDKVTEAGVASQAAPLTNQIASPTKHELAEWHKTMRKTPPPKKGCFQASIPSTKWQEVPCVTAPPVPHLRPGLVHQSLATAAQPQSVGNGLDFSASVSGTISQVVGSFPSVTGVTSETTQDTGHGNTCLTSPCLDNFSLQINTNVFPRNTATGACSGNIGTCDGSKNPDGSQNTSCSCWQQFIFDNQTSLGLFNATIYMQYWLLNYGSVCPSSGGWISDNQGSCFRNSDAASLLAQSITNLSNLTLTGSTAPGGSDFVIASAGNGTATAHAADNEFNLSQAWNNAEFNVFGDGDLTLANFNGGATIVVQESVTNGTTASPTCNGPVNGGDTGETNNLTLVPGSCCATGGASPAIQFTESNAGASAPFCLLNDIVPIQSPLL